MEIKLKLRIKGVEIELDQNEAKELHEMLDGLMSNEKTQIIREYWPWYDTRRTYPYIWKTYPYVKWDTGSTCTDMKVSVVCD